VDHARRVMAAKDSPRPTVASRSTPGRRAGWAARLVGRGAAGPPVPPNRVSLGLDEPVRRQRGGELGTAHAQAAGQGALPPCFGFTPLECRVAAIALFVVPLRVADSTDLLQGDPQRALGLLGQARSRLPCRPFIEAAVAKIVATSRVVSPWRAY